MPRGLIHRRSLKLVGAALFLVAGLAAAGLIALNRRTGSDRPLIIEGSLHGQGTPQRLWRLPDFHGVDQAGRPVGQAALRGRVWLADFIYTSCTSACPMLTARMVVTSRRLDPSVGLLSFSVDPAHDTPAALAAYARRWPAGGRRWTLVHLDAPALDAFAGGMHVLVDRSGGDGNIAHSTQIFLIDGDGWVRGAYLGEDEREMAALVRDARALAGAGGAAPVAAGDARATTDGARLFTELGCLGCHADARIAPLLGGFQGRAVPLQGGAVARADASYVRAAILTPAAQIVKGYEATMPSYRELLTAPQLAALVDYVAALPDPGGGHAVVSAVDPVCGMHLVVTADTPRVVRDGKTLYFCSATCRDRYLRAPARSASGRRLAPGRGG
jgi:protein SCO1/2